MAQDVLTGIQNYNWNSGFPSQTVSINAGQIIRASDLNAIATQLNQMINHTHNFTDKYQQATYGNNGDRNNYSQTSTSNGPDGVGTLNSTVGAGQVIDHSHANTLINYISPIAYHRHYENDRNSI